MNNYLSNICKKIPLMWGLHMWKATLRRWIPTVQWTAGAEPVEIMRRTGIPGRNQSNYNQRLYSQKDSNVNLTFGSQTQKSLLLQEFVSLEGRQISANRENPCTTKNDRYQLRHLYSISLDLGQLKSSPKKLSTTAQSVKCNPCCQKCSTKLPSQPSTLPSSLPRAVNKASARFHNFLQVCFTPAPVLWTLRIPLACTWLSDTLLIFLSPLP